MIKIIENYIKIDTPNSSLVFNLSNTIPTYVYYGKKINDKESFSKYEVDAIRTDVKINKNIISFYGDEDYKEPSIKLINGSNNFNLNFKLVKYEILDELALNTSLPFAKNKDKILAFYLEDIINSLSLVVYYSTYKDSDVISTITVLKNNSNNSIRINKLASLNLELNGIDGFDVYTFTGSWANERNKNVTHITSNMFVNESKTGSSSSYANPLVVLKNQKGYYGFNLIYSGNHKETLEIDIYKKNRFISGINDFMLDYTLNSNEEFITPEAIMAYGVSSNSLSHCLQKFVLNHIIRKEYASMARPILVNNWEGTYMDFTGKKILEMASVAKEVGAELFVLDDGWFGKRDTDWCALGDWYDYTSKTGGIDKLANDVKKLGLQFGIWMEPEMISEDSDLYRAHPEYAMKIENKEPFRHRHQLHLDLVNPEVKQYVIDCVTNILELTKANYLKWDYNRNFSDVYSTYCSIGEYYHKYMLSFYEIKAEIIKRFPHVLFEGCAAGGSRFDLGILSFFPQIWTSDNTDPYDRIKIQTSTSYGYPQSTMGAHVSKSPNEWTKRENSLNTRFFVALGGDLGYELDTTKLTDEEKVVVKEQIKFYKKNRKLLQYGIYSRINNPFTSNNGGFVITNKNKSEAVFVLTSTSPKNKEDIIVLEGLDDKKTYEAISFTNSILLTFNGNASFRAFDLLEKEEKDGKYAIYSNMFVVKEKK